MCVSPLFIKRENKPRRGDTVPCGKCHLCKKKHMSQWLFRLTEELTVSTSAYFVTLTYNNENLKDLNKRDVQLFYKRLRKIECGNAKSFIKYFTVGEYGTINKRPHYHAIIFNVKNSDNINKAWNMGFTYAPPVQSVRSITYTLKYIHKDDTIKRFTMMSKNLGASYLTKEMIHYHTSDLRNVIAQKNGRRMAIPKYYKERIYNEEQRAEVTRILHAFQQSKHQALVDRIGDVKEFQRRAVDHYFKPDISDGKISNLQDIIQQLRKN